MHCHQTLAHSISFLPVFAYIFRKTIRCGLDRVVCRDATLLTCVASVLLETEVFASIVNEKR